MPPACSIHVVISAACTSSRVGDRVQLLDASYDGVWELRVLGEVPPTDAVLVRPDGHVAWVGEGGEEGLPEALAVWFGSPCQSA